MSRIAIDVVHNPLVKSLSAGSESIYQSNKVKYKPSLMSFLPPVSLSPLSPHIHSSSVKIAFSSRHQVRIHQAINAQNSTCAL